jgi:hypothetical protein
MLPRIYVFSHMGAQPPPTSGRNIFVRNMEPDAALQALIPAHLQLHTVIKNDPVPLNDSNLPMCLSFHLRRGCWSQCKRAHDHNHTLSGREQQRVVSFVSAQLTKLSSVLPPPAASGPQTVPPTAPPIPSGVSIGSRGGSPPSRG